MGEFTAALLDSYPIFRVLPDFMLPLRQYAKQVHADIFDLYVGHWLTAKKAIKNGTAKPCFCVDLVRAQDEERFSDGIAGYVSGSLLEAGSDTTASTLVGCAYERKNLFTRNVLTVVLRCSCSGDVALSRSG